MTSLRDTIREVIARKDGKYDREGDPWLCWPNPEEAYLDVDALTDAVYDAIDALKEAVIDEFRSASRWSRPPGREKRGGVSE